MSPYRGSARVVIDELAHLFTLSKDSVLATVEAMGALARECKILYVHMLRREPKEGDPVPRAYAIMREQSHLVEGRSVRFAGPGNRCPDQPHRPQTLRQCHRPQASHHPHRPEDLQNTHQQHRAQVVRCLRRPPASLRRRRPPASHRRRGRRRHCRTTGSQRSAKNDISFATVVGDGGRAMLSMLSWIGHTQTP